MSNSQEISGYTYGSNELMQSPVTLADLEALKKTVLFTEEDEKYLRKSKTILEPHVEDLLDTWYGFVGSNEHLVYYFANSETKKPDEEYLAKVRERFKVWVFDTADANYDQKWLDYQHEIGLRHHTTKKNKTDGVTSVPIIHFRYLIALHYPVTATIKPFLAKGGDSPEEIEKMHQAWIKSVMIHAILWCYPYIKDGEF